MLEHHGVKGMKWGSKKGGSTSSHPPSADHVVVEGHKAKIKSGGVKALSNVELQQVVTRASLEQQHSRLAPKTGTHRAVKVVGDVLANVGKQHLTKVVGNLAEKAIKKQVGV